MPQPRYDVRAGWLAGDWVEIGSKYSWNQIAGNFRWEELQAGPMPNEDIDELQIQRAIGTMFNRLSTGECRVQIDNGRGQYTGTKSAQNLVVYSDNVSSGTFWLSQNGATSLNVLVGKTGAIDAAAYSEDSATGTHSLRTPNMASINSGQVHVVCGEFYAGTRDRFELRSKDGFESSIFGAGFSLRSMQVSYTTFVSSGEFIGASMQAIGDGWVRCWVVGRLPITGGVSLCGIRVYQINSAGTTSYTGTGSAWMGVRGFVMNTGTIPATYVPTTNSLAVIPRDTNLAINDVFAVKAVDGSSVYNIFSGYLDEWAFNPALVDLRKIAISCSDVANRLRPIISTSLMLAPTHSTIIQAVLSASGINENQYQVDQINDLAAYAYVDQMSAGEALSQIQQNGAEIYYVNGAGKLIIRSRHYDVRSTSVVGSYAAGFQMATALTTDEIVNKVEVRTTPRAIFPDVSTVAWLTDAVFIPGGASKQFVLDYVDARTNESGVPAFSVEAQVKGLDFQCFADPEGLGSNITSQFNVVVSLNATSAAFSVTNAGGANGYIVVCQLMGKPVTRGPELVRTLQDPESVALYQERFGSVQGDLLYTDNRVRNLAEFILVNNSKPRPSLAFAIKNEWPGSFSHDLLDRVFISNSLSNVGSSFIIEQVEHTITFNAGTEHVLQMKLRVAPIKNWFTNDSPTLGRLNYNQLGF
jgi:hypothetical protein